MIELRIAAGALDLDPETSISLEEKSPAYLGENVGVLEGEYSYPFTLPLTDNNREVLGYPDRLDNSAILLRRVPGQLYIGGDLHIDGLLYLEQPSRASVKVYLVANALLNIKDISLREVSERSYTLPSDVPSHMKAVSEDPLGYDYTFFPVYNPSIAEGENFAADRWQNTFFPGTQSFTIDGEVSPFPRLEVLLADIITATGYAFSNEFQIDEELRRLCLVHNLTLKEGNTIDRDFTLSSLLPDQKAGEYVRELCRAFCLAPFLDKASRTIRLKPLKNLLRSATTKDWTRYAGKEYSYTQGQAALLRHEYASGAYSDAVNVDQQGVDWAADIKQADILTDSFGNIEEGEYFDERYYEHSTGRVFRPQLNLPPESQVFFLRKSIAGRHFGAIDNTEGTETNSVKVYPIFTEFCAVPNGFVPMTAPVWRKSMVGFGANTDTRLAFHYGEGLTSTGNEYPFGGFTPYTYVTTQIDDASYSLAWEGPDGLYEKWWKSWDEMLRKGKLVSRNFLLPIAELNSFTFDQKVRVGNKDYFIQSLKYAVSLRSKEEVNVEARLLSIF